MFAEKYSLDLYCIFTLKSEIGVGTSKWRPWNDEICKLEHYIRQM